VRDLYHASGTVRVTCGRCTFKALSRYHLPPLTFTPRGCNEKNLMAALCGVIIANYGNRWIFDSFRLSDIFQALSPTRRALNFNIYHRNLWKMRCKHVRICVCVCVCVCNKIKICTYVVVYYYVVIKCTDMILFFWTWRCLMHKSTSLSSANHSPEWARLFIAFSLSLSLVRNNAEDGSRI